MIDSRLLRSQMVLKNLHAKDLAKAQCWSISTTYRKIKGSVSWSIPELKLIKELLNLDLDTWNAIFFAPNLP